MELLNDILDIILIVLAIAVLCSWLYVSWHMNKALDKFEVSFEADVKRFKEPHDT